MSHAPIPRSSVLVHLLGCAVLGAGVGCSGDSDAGDPDPDPPPATHTLELSVSGSGTALVISDDGVMSCADACIHDYPAGTTVTLTAEVEPGSGILGWAGDCTGTAGCAVTLDQDRAVALDVVGGRIIDGRVVEAPDNQQAFAVAAAPDGSYVVAGRMSGSIQVGTYHLTAVGERDMLLVRYDSDGTVMWARRYGTVGSTVPAALLIDGDAVYVTGYYDQATDLGAGAMAAPSGFDGFTGRFDLEDGDPLWTHAFGTIGGDEGVSIEMNPDGVILVTSVTNGPDFEAGVLAHDRDTGGAIGAMLSQGTGTVLPYDATITADGGFIVVGRFSGEVSFDGGATTVDADTLGAFVVRYDATDLSHEWTRADLSAGPAGAWARGVAAEPDGDLVVVGNVAGEHDFGDGVRQTDSLDAFVLALDPSGSTRWSRTDPGVGEGQYVAVALGAAGEIYATGYFAGEAAFGDETAVADGARDGVVVRSEPDGELVWWNQIRGEGEALAWDLAVDQGGVILVGTALGELDASGVMVGAGVAGDFFTARYGK